ncbi:DprA-like DNA recombination-mediator protein [Acinetobacter phage Presley]|uniref:Uncharacterized protein n=1 Tax=Acinetobacter phage Presley TaxID=1406780 RepID=U5PW00_9CAUD|nr:DprA-like DNA recombination-mediator protein [Acinetobacter phage Presley]AGY48084.1 hypothetical protein Presley_17 [Acinetobacter phage Presley]
MQHQQPYKPYAAFGSRDTPDDVLEIMAMIGGELEAMGFTMRNGGASGADEAFLTNIQNPSTVELYLPWQGFNGYESDMSEPKAFAYEVAFLNHPNWSACNEKVRKLHARNSYIALGLDSKDTKSLFGVCWTPNGACVGGSGQTIRVLDTNLIPVFNLGEGEHVLDALIEFVNKL